MNELIFRSKYSSNGIIIFDLYYYLFLYILHKNTHNIQYVYAATFIKLKKNKFFLSCHRKKITCLIRPLVLCPKGDLLIHVSVCYVSEQFQNPITHIYHHSLSWHETCTSIKKMCGGLITNVVSWAQTQLQFTLRLFSGYLTK